MSFYNMLFGMNDQADLLLAVIGLKKNDIERFRDVRIEDDGKTIAVYTRTGGGNRAYYPNLTMRKLATWLGSEDDDFDCTYCTDRFAVPEKFVEDVRNLGDILSHGLRAEFAQHLAATLRREETDGDKAAAAYDAEERALARTAHVKANGHTFVPYDDYAMQKALELAEANEGRLRSCRGILPLVLKVKRDFRPFPNAKADDARLHMVRVEISYHWEIDEAYWEHCQERWAAKFPKAIAEIEEAVLSLRNRKRA